MKHFWKVAKIMDSSSMDFKYRRFCFPLIVAVIMVGHLSTPAQFVKTRTKGVIYGNCDTAAGYTFFAPWSSGKTSYLVDNFGRLVHSWTSSAATPGSTFLLENGSILRCEKLNNQFNSGGSGGRVKIISWEGETTWTYDYANSDHCQHHGFRYLPNGNVLIIAWEMKSASEASAAGRTGSSAMWPGHIIEVEPSGATGGDIVWEWHAWDHLVKDNVADHPELIDINFSGAAEAGMGMMGSGDWMHTNNVDYDPETDRILLSVRYFSEVWIIDHSTTKEQAASHSGGNYGKGGDILYRFGNPAAHGGSGDRQLYTQHDAHWIPAGKPGAGNVLVFNNGTQSRAYSTADEFELPLDGDGNYDMGKIPEHVWSWRIPGSMASTMSSVMRMKNGNTLVVHGPNGKYFEVDKDGDSVWVYGIPSESLSKTTFGGGGGVFRGEKFGPDYAAFEGRDMTPESEAMDGQDLYDFKGCKGINDSLAANVNRFVPGFSLSNSLHSSNSISAKYIHLSIPHCTDVSLKIYSADGREIVTLVNRYLSAGDYNYSLSANGLANGMYFVRLVTEKYATTNRMFLIQ